MRDGGSSAQAVRTRWCAWATRCGRLLVLAALLGLAAGCGHMSSPGPAASSATGTGATRCGQTKSAADVPVDVEVVKGGTACAAALSIERAYAEAIRSGRAPGNGGGGPVKIQSWTCQGFATPVVLATGKTSKCVKPGNEILETLPPTGSG